MHWKNVSGQYRTVKESEKLKEGIKEIGYKLRILVEGKGYE